MKYLRGQGKENNFINDLSLCFGVSEYLGQFIDE